MEKKYIIRAKYHTTTPYHITLDYRNNPPIPIMTKLRASAVNANEFGFTLHEAEQVLKMYKQFLKKKHSEHLKYCTEFINHGYQPPNATYTPRSYYLEKKTRTKTQTEKMRQPNGEYGWKWRHNE